MIFGCLAKDSTVCYCSMNENLEDVKALSRHCQGSQTGFEADFDLSCALLSQ